MNFTTPEANEFFKIAILVEKKMLGVSKEIDKGNIPDNEFFDIKSTLNELINVNKTNLNIFFKKKLESKGIQNNGE